jgi:hypothetical protein
VPPTDAAALRAARRLVIHTVRVATDFADTLYQRVSREEPPATGSARAAALSVVALCLAFARNSSDASRATESRIVEYNRDVELLRSALNNLRSSADYERLVPHPRTVLAQPATVHAGTSDRP